MENSCHVDWFWNFFADVWGLVHWMPKRNSMGIATQHICSVKGGCIKAAQALGSQSSI